MTGYCHVIEQCGECGSYEWKYEFLESGSRRTCWNCGNVVEDFWETAVSDNNGSYHFLSDMEELDQSSN